MRNYDRKPAAPSGNRISLGMVIIVVLSIVIFTGLYSPGQTEAAPISVINQFSTTPCATGTGNMTCTSPAIGAGSNRVLVLVVTGEANGNHNPANTTATYGTATFTEVQNSYGNNDNRRYTWMGFINESQIAGNSGSNISITATSSAAWVGTEAYYVVCGNVDQTSPLSGSVKADSPNTTTTVSMGPITTVVDGVAIYAISANATAGNTTVPTGYTEYVDQADASNNYYTTIGSRTSVPGTSESVSMTAVNSRWTAAFMALSPAPAGGPTGNLQFSASDYGVNEDVGNVTISVTRTGGSSGAASVNYATSDGTAVQPGDYTSASGTLNWADGDAADKTFTVTIINDLAAEPSETLNLTLSSASGASLGSPSAATVTILANDSAAAAVPVGSWPLFIAVIGGMITYGALWRRRQRGMTS